MDFARRTGSEGPNLASWLSLLARQHTLIRYDFRGCGLSDRQTREVSFDRLVDDLDAVIAAANPGQRYSLFGIAGGCAIAMASAVRRPDHDLEFQDLTVRGREILELLAQGLDNNRIADRLGISQKTVRNHVSTGMAKRGLQNRSQVIVRAREAGFGHKPA